MKDQKQLSFKAKLLGIQIDYKKQKSNVFKATLIYVVFPLLQTVLIPISFYFLNKCPVILQFGTLCYTFINFLRVFYFAQLFFVCFAVTERFFSLNENLRKCARKTLDQEVSRPFNMNGYLKVFHGLSDGIDIINTAFTSQFILLLGNVLVRLKPFTEYSLNIVFTGFGSLHGIRGCKRTFETF